MWSDCVLDASMGCRDGIFTFCPIEGDIAGEYQVVEGMMHLGSKPPDSLRLVAIVHPDGQAAIESFCQQYKKEIEAMK